MATTIPLRMTGDDCFLPNTALVNIWSNALYSQNGTNIQPHTVKLFARDGAGEMVLNIGNTWTGNSYKIPCVCICYLVAAASGETVFLETFSLQQWPRGSRYCGFGVGVAVPTTVSFFSTQKLNILVFVKVTVFILICQQHFYGRLKILCSK